MKWNKKPLYWKRDQNNIFICAPEATALQRGENTRLPISFVCCLLRSATRQTRPEPWKPSERQVNLAYKTLLTNVIYTFGQKRFHAQCDINWNYEQCNLWSIEKGATSIGIVREKEINGVLFSDSWNKFSACCKCMAIKTKPISERSVRHASLCDWLPPCSYVTSIGQAVCSSSNRYLSHQNHVPTPVTACSIVNSRKSKQRQCQWCVILNLLLKLD